MPAPRAGRSSFRNLAALGPESLSLLRFQIILAIAKASGYEAARKIACAGVEHGGDATAQRGKGDFVEACATIRGRIDISSPSFTSPLKFHRPPLCHRALYRRALYRRALYPHALEPIF